VVTASIASDHKTVRGRAVGVAFDRTGVSLIADDVRIVV
jgi:hypothetical protein